MTDVERIERKLGVIFKDKEILKEAFIHPSYANATGEESNQRLEFLGDSFINFTVAKILYDNFPKEQEGFLTVERSKIVSKEGLKKATEALDIIDYLKIGKGQGDVKSSDKVLCDLYEAVVGAIFLDLGIEVAFGFVKKTLKDALSEAGKSDNVDYKSKLLEYGAQNNLKVEFNLIEQSGASHSPNFKMEVRIDGNNFGTAKAGSKKTAEQLSAKYALEALNIKA